MLQGLDGPVQQLFSDIAKNGTVDPVTPYSCNLCHRCTLHCPQQLKLGELFFAMRQELVANKNAPLKGHAPVVMNQRLNFSGFFNGSYPAGRRTERIFFPGCALAAYSPSAVGKLYGHLRENLGNVGALMACCAKPTLAIGQQELFEQRLEPVCRQIKETGAVEVITACQSCYKIFEAYLPKLAPGVTVKSLWVVLNEIGLPKASSIQSPAVTLAVHDSCVTRDVPEIHAAVRQIISDLGYSIEELAASREKTRCCGQGGMIAPVNPLLAQKLMKRRAAEAQSDYIATYCAGCRASMVWGGKQGLHMVDLIYRDNWDGKTAPSVGNALVSWWNRWKTKGILARMSK
jgi:Fe-S oxidoreductase